MLQLIAPPSYDHFARDLADMHRLRYRVFKLRLGWDVDVRDEMERDRFDDLHPIYLLQKDREGRVSGCARLLPSLGPTMLQEVFPQLLHGAPMRASPSIWESSRFAVDAPDDAPKAAGGIAVGTYELFAGLVELGLAKELREIVTVTDVRLERILRRASWPLQRLGPPLKIGNTLAVAGLLGVSRSTLFRLREAGGLDGPALWSPVAP
jgi:acyl homoserine lactone synthase